MKKKRFEDEETGSVVDVQLSQSLVMDWYEPVCGEGTRSIRGRRWRTKARQGWRMGVSDLDLADKVRGVGLDGPAMVVVNVLLNHAGV